jgi:phosphatidylglycerophosphate synthase
MLDGALGPLVRLACESGLQPNAITLSSVVTTCAIVYFHVAGGPTRLAVPLLMLYKWLADVLDGAVARACDRSSSLGGALDTAADALFAAVAVAALLSSAAPRRFAPLGTATWAVAALAALLPWAAIAAANGPRALYEHSAFKTSDGAINSAAWFASENTLLITLVLAAAYYALAVPRGSAVGAVRAAASSGPTAVSAISLATMVIVVLVSPSSTNDHAVNRFGAAALLLMLSAAVLHGVWCLSSSSGGCPSCLGSAYIAAGVVAVLVTVWMAPSIAAAVKGATPPPTAGGAPASGR